LQLTDEWADTQIDVDDVKGCIASIITQKRSQNSSYVKILISIGGGGKGSEHFPTVASNPNLRARFASSVRAFVDNYGFDGADSKSFILLKDIWMTDSISSRLGASLRRIARHFLHLPSHLSPLCPPKSPLCPHVCSPHRRMASPAHQPRRRILHSRFHHPNGVRLHRLLVPRTRPPRRAVSTSRPPIAPVWPHRRPIRPTPARPLAPETRPGRPMLRARLPAFSVSSAHC
jgi:hypothetical protein